MYFAPRLISQCDGVAAVPPATSHHEAIPEAPWSYLLGYVRLGCGARLLLEEWRVREALARDYRKRKCCYVLCED